VSEYFGVYDMLPYACCLYLIVLMMFVYVFSTET